MFLLFEQNTKYLPFYLMGSSVGMASFTGNEDTLGRLYKMGNQMDIGRREKNKRLCCYFFGVGFREI